MPYPPTLPPNNRTDTTPSFSNHPGDHNAIVNALTAIIAELGNDPSGAFADLTARLGNIAPVGCVQLYAGDTAPTNWMLCNGGTANRTTHSVLFGIIGTSYGAGDGSTTFNVPNLEGRFPIGRDPANALFNARGEVGGSADSVLLAHVHALDHNHGPKSTDTKGAHSHGIAASRYILNQTNVGGPAGGAQIAPSMASASGQDLFVITGANGGDHSHTVDIDALTGVDSQAAKNSTPAPVSTGTNRNYPPFMAMHYIIRVL